MVVPLQPCVHTCRYQWRTNLLSLFPSVPQHSRPTTSHTSSISTVSVSHSLTTSIASTTSSLLSGVRSLCSAADSDSSCEGGLTG